MCCNTYSYRHQKISDESLEILPKQFYLMEYVRRLINNKPPQIYKDNRNPSNFPIMNHIEINLWSTCLTFISGRPTPHGNHGKQPVKEIAFDFPVCIWVDFLQRE